MDSTLFAFPPSKAPELMPPLALAYIGDAIYEMYVRQYLLSLPNHRPNHLHKQASRIVAARAQAKLLTDWLPLLDEDELDIVRRGRNAKSGSAPKSADILEYRHSTAFECLIGYLYYQQRFDRLKHLLDQVIKEIGGR
ncbi:MAG: Mini-ribonuclease 3 [Paenibacillaceae bacterium]